MLRKWDWKAIAFKNDKYFRYGIYCFSNEYGAWIYVVEDSRGLWPKSAEAYQRFEWTDEEVAIEYIKNLKPIIFIDDEVNLKANKLYDSGNYKGYQELLKSYCVIYNT